MWITPAIAYDLVLAWDPNGEPDLAGYVLYVDDGTSEFLYEYIDTYPLEGINPKNPSVKVTGLKDDLAYYFVVTAYDTAGNESDYSDEVCVMNGKECPSSWAVYRSSLSESASVSSSSNAVGVSSGGGGGGGGCFISSLNYSKKNISMLTYLHIILFPIGLSVIGIIGLLGKKNTRN